MSDGYAFSGDEIAAAWEHYRTQLFEGQRPVSDWIVDHLDPQPGQTILELAAGPGETGFLVAERVGSETQDGEKEELFEFAEIGRLSHESTL